MFYPQLPSGRHSGAAPGVVILAQPESPYWPLFVFVRHSGVARISVLVFVCFCSSFWRSQNLRIGLCLFLFVILAKPESPYWSLFVFVRHSGAARISVVAFVAPLHFRIQNKTHRINILPASLRE
jgi:hypothetical protein